jgi:hypothetical protein
MYVRKLSNTGRPSLITTEKRGHERATGPWSITGIYQTVPKTKARHKKGGGGSQGAEWANSLREGDPTSACYIGEQRPYAHVMLKV